MPRFALCSMHVDRHLGTSVQSYCGWKTWNGRALDQLGFVALALVAEPPIMDNERQALFMAGSLWRATR